MELGEVGVEDPIASTEFVVRVPSSDAPEKLIVLVNALAVENRVHNSLTNIKASDYKFEREIV